LDVIIGGHSHTLITKPIITRTGAIIVQAGAFGEYLGHLDLQFDLNARKIAEYRYTAIKVDPKNMTPNHEMGKKIDETLQHYGPDVDRPFCSVSRSQDKRMMAALLGRAANEVLHTDAAVIDVKTVWETLSAGPVTRQQLLDCYKVEFQPSDTYGFNSVYAVEIDGVHLQNLHRQEQDRFVFVSTINTIDPLKTYRLAIQRRTALLIDNFFTQVALRSEPVFEGEAWDILTRYGSIKTSKGLALDE
jgi:hypothetical protein